MIISTVLGGMEKVANQLLKLDLEVSEELLALKGKVVKVVITDMNQHVFLAVRKETIRLSQHYDLDPNATIKGSSTKLLKSYATGFEVGSGIEVEGDVEFVEDLNRLMHKYKIDWEELLSQVVGDIAAHKIHSAVCSVLDWGKDAAKRLALDVGEYVHEEGRLAPSAEELEDFFSQIAEVRDGIERAQARLNLIN